MEKTLYSLRTWTRQRDDPFGERGGEEEAKGKKLRG